VPKRKRRSNLDGPCRAALRVVADVNGTQMVEKILLRFRISESCRYNPLHVPHYLVKAFMR
jgi:hypothetical protein